jgi:hypothetical protein
MLVKQVLLPLESHPQPLALFFFRFFAIFEIGLHAFFPSKPCTAVLLPISLA